MSNFHGCFEEYVAETDMNTSKLKPKLTPSSSTRSSAKKRCMSYHVSNYRCEVVANALKKITAKYAKTCKSVIKVLKASPRTKFKTHLFVTAMPDFMERIHSLDFSNRVIFLDGTDNANRFNCSVFVLMVDSHVGALPLGFFVTLSKGPGLMEQMFRSLNEILPNNAFNTPPFPKVVITGIDNAEHTSMSRSFSTVRTYIGTFRLLRDVWKFLWERESEVDLNDRTLIFKLFENMIRSPNEEKFNQNVLTLVESETCRKYSKFQKYLSTLLKKKDLWDLDFRIKSHISYDKDIITSEKHVLKENILHNCRMCNVSDVYEFLCTTYCDYYKKKILEATSGIIESLSELSYLPGDKELVADLRVAVVYQNEVLVINTKRKNEYYVNRELGTCSCVLGKHGTPCVHQYVVAKKFDSYLFRIAAMSEDQKCKYKYLANGNEMNECGMVEDPTEANSTSSEIENGNHYPDDSTEYVIVSNVDNNIQETQSQHSTEDCIQAIEIFWSKLSPYIDDHADHIYNWIMSMNAKIDDAESFDDVLSILRMNARS